MQEKYSFVCITNSMMHQKLTIYIQVGAWLRPYLTDMDCILKVKLVQKYMARGTCSLWPFIQSQTFTANSGNLVNHATVVAEGVTRFRRS